MPNVDEIIRNAMARGEFDNLAGAGKPIDLSAYFDTPEEIRLAYSVLKSADILPQEAELLKEIAGLKDAAEGEKDLAKRARLLKQVEGKRLEFNLTLERQKRLSKL
ncbi:MAG: DUF1992 domain-containing protein [Chloroflexi bacterium]|nr:DUF1992 domain-containing protein [Chloroflexota bacterium]